MTKRGMGLSSHNPSDSKQLLSVFHVGMIQLIGDYANGGFPFPAANILKRVAQATLN